MPTYEYEGQKYELKDGLSNKDNMEPYTPDEINAILEQGWAIVSGQEMPNSGSGGGTTVVEEKEVIKLD